MTEPADGRSLIIMNTSAGCQRAVIWLVMGAYAVLASGLPLPLGVDPPASSPAAKRLAGKDRSTPFPCMDKPCGCATAEQCFTSCCCHSPAETLAWARARGVEPAVIAALQLRVAAAPARAERSCCAVKETSDSGGSGVSSCCAVTSAAAVSSGVAGSTSCCEAGAAVPVGNDPADSSEDPDSRKSLSLRAMLACSGIVAEWFSCGGSLPPPHVEIVTGLDLIETLPGLNESASPLRAAPDAPPPRVG